MGRYLIKKHLEVRRLLEGGAYYSLKLSNFISVYWHIDSLLTYRVTSGYIGLQLILKWGGAYLRPDAYKRKCSKAEDAQYSS